MGLVARSSGGDLEYNRSSLRPDTSVLVEMDYIVDVQGFKQPNNHFVAKG